MNFDVAYAATVFPRIVAFLGTTLLVTVLTCLAAAALGFLLEVLRRANMPARYVLGFVIDFIRSTPVLVQIYFLYFVLPIYGIRLPAMVVGIAALSLYYSGYLAEVFKAGIDSVALGQWEAAKALGLGWGKTVVLVIAPQMLRNVAAPMSSYFISIFKTTPVLAVIAVPEAFGAALDAATDSFRYVEPLAVVGAIFLSIAVTFSLLVRRLEARFARATRR
jgi:polar amino acid transport system permease protein